MPSCACNCWQMARMRGLGAKDWLRRLCSNSRKPPAKRRLKQATPQSHVATSEGRTLGDRLGETRWLIAFNGAATDGMASSNGVGADAWVIAGTAMTAPGDGKAWPAGFSKTKKVAAGAANIRPSAPTAIR